MMDIMKRMITGQGLDVQSGETGDRGQGVKKRKKWRSANV